MAGASLLMLIDDIASVLDDVAVMTKVAAKKTAGVLGDDLALNAQQVAGVRAERELPVVWAVAKGSVRNKLVLVPAALALSALLPSLVTPLLMIGGAYLCYEGVEKLAHRWLHPQHGQAHEATLAALDDPAIDIVAAEREKIRGAVRTDFILSAEIIVIALGTVQQQPLPTQLAVLAGIAALMTVGVYGFVAAIVKLDDIGLHLLRAAPGSVPGTIARGLGHALLALAPRLLHFLSFAGTAAMFLVGGSILVHGLEQAHALQHAIGEAAGAASWLALPLFDALLGVVAGALVLGAVTGFSKLRRAVAS